ncbi:MAG: hypothetical protein IJS97_09490 [Prevotella sp.]|nr:hypothetical protein [Prevotella sp.]
MIIIRNSILPPRRFEALNLFGVLFCRKHAELTESLIRHERIHTAQMVELLFVGFYLWYAVEWLVRRCQGRNAYGRMSFEREAYTHMHEPNYLKHRRQYAWMKYL